MTSKFHRFAMAGFCTLALAACGGRMQVVSANSDAVTIRHTADAAGAAEREALNQCQRYGKKERLRSHHTDSTTETFSIWDCVPL
jgi:hypothetical protein